MNSKQLAKLQSRLESSRRGQPKVRELVNLAESLGRKITDQGKHPMYESLPFPHLRPLSIPNHGSKGLATGTKLSILSQLDDDVMAWQELLESEENL